MGDFSRRSVVGAAFAAGALMGRAAQPSAGRPRLGVVTSIGKMSPDQAIARVQLLGLPTCQVSLGPAPDANSAGQLKEALAKYQIEATAVMTGGPGHTVWDFYEGPKTIGLVPPDTRAARVHALKGASDVARACGIEAVHTHCGFIPEDPNDPMYAPTVAAIREVATYCKANGQTFLMETGQETPITVVRTIEDAAVGNIGVNLDAANLILYGKGEPVGALDVLGRYVRGLHAKDGLYPTDPKKLGQEVAIGKGKVNFPELIRGLHRLAYAGPITIEREISGPQQAEDIRASKTFLQDLINATYLNA